MGSYFFHLSFELYPHPAESIASDLDIPANIYLPPAGTDLFKARLPSHPSKGRRPDSKQDSTFDRPANGVVDAGWRRVSSGTDQTFRASSVGRGVAKGPESLGRDPLSAHFSGSLNLADPCQDCLGTSAPRDWRFDQVSIESIDMATGLRRTDEPSTTTSIGSISNGLDPGSGGLAAKGKYVPLDPKNTELGWGVVHLYRDAAETPGLYDDVGNCPSNGVSDASASRHGIGEELKRVDDDDCTTLCILAVPSYLTPSDLLGFVGEKTREIVSHFRMVRTGATNRYMVLMKFRSPKKAKQWRKEWNGKLFNSMEPENCHVVFVKSIQFQTPGRKGDPSSFPDITNDPFTPPSDATTTATSSSAVPSTTLSAKPLAPPTPALVELPTCPVCLERMDETTGLLTILCQHVFHCACLQKWRGSGCPVCRYTQGDGLVNAHRMNGATDDDFKERVCSVCHSEANLWICLICGNVGCGRYDEAHAFSHYQESSHSFAMDVDTQRVWDYGGDGYVHRLIQNKSDGKLVELPSHNSSGAAQPDITTTSDGHSPVPRDKLDDIGMEYTHLLTSQLDSQRLYFEEKVAQAADKASEASHTAQAAAASAQQSSDAMAKLERAHASLTQDLVPSLEREKARAERKAEKSAETARKMEREWREEKAMNGSLLERVALLGKELTALKEQNAELQEQNRDLTFFISGQEKLGALGEEVQEGTVTVGAAPEKKRKGKGRK